MHNTETGLIMQMNSNLCRSRTYKPTVLTLLFSFFMAMSCHQQVNQPASNNDPECATKRVSEISDPSRETDFLIHVCGEEVTTELVDKQIEADEYQSKASQEPKKTWEEASAWAFLNAQEGMTGYTFWIMIATIAGAAIGSVGLYFLYQTFQATVRTANAAENAERAQVYIEPKIRLAGKKSTFIPGVEGTLYSLEFNIVNYGRTPATAVNYSITPKGSNISKDVIIADANEPNAVIDEINFLPSSEENKIQLLREPAAEKGFSCCADENIPWEVEWQYTDFAGRRWEASMEVHVLLFGRPSRDEEDEPRFAMMEAAKTGNFFLLYSSNRRCNIIKLSRNFRLQLDIRGYVCQEAGKKHG